MIISIVAILRNSGNISEHSRDLVVALLPGTLSWFYGAEHGLVEFMNLLRSHPWLHGDDRLGQLEYKQLSNEFEGYIEVLAEYLSKLAIGKAEPY